MHFSYWEQKHFLDGYDVAIIGSGIVGLSAAIHLRTSYPSLKVVVLERGMLPYGASTRNAGFACFGSASELLDDLSSRAESEVFALVEKRWKGLKMLRNTLGDSNINYESAGGYEVFTAAEKRLYEECADKLNYLNEKLSAVIGSGKVYQIVSDRIDTFGFSGVQHLILNTEEGQLDTGKMMGCLLNKAVQLGVVVMNGVTVASMEDAGNNVALEVKQSIEGSPSVTYSRMKVGKVLIATNGFAKLLVPDLDVHPARAQVLVTSKIPGLKIKGAFHLDRGYYYFRDVDGRLLLVEEEILTLPQMIPWISLLRNAYRLVLNNCLGRIFYLTLLTRSIIAGVASWDFLPGVHLINLRSSKRCPAMCFAQYEWVVWVLRLVF